MQNLSPLDEASLRVQMRKMFRDVGWTGCYQALYEIIRSAEILIDILIEEQLKDNNSKWKR